MTKQERLYRRYRSLIEADIAKDGERLPSLRELAKETRSSVNTVIAAYGRLCDEGLARSVERGGFFVRRRGAIGAAEPPRPAIFTAGATDFAERLDQLFERLAAMDSSFAVASPGLDLLPAERLRRGLAGLSRGWVGYAEVSGDPELKRRIALASEPWNGTMAARDLVICSGATEALSLVFRTLLRPGDTVVLEAPTYFNYFRQLAPFGVRLVEIPVGEDGMDLDLLERELASAPPRAVLVQPNVQNPTGITMSDGAKARLLASVAAAGSVLIQDDVYGDLHFGPARPPNLGVFGSYDGLVTVSSFSKSVAPGLRVGWVHSPVFSRRIVEEKLRSSMDTCALGQGALVDFVGSSAHRRHLGTLRSALERRVDAHLRLLDGGLPPGCSVRRPSGGCLLWIAAPETVDATKLFVKAAGRGLVAAPGELFSGNPFFRNYIRINAGWALSPEREGALRRLAGLMADAHDSGTPSRCPKSGPPPAPPAGTAPSGEKPRP